jgi:hypothetical protein
VGLALLLFGNPWNELQLIQDGVSTTGSMVSFVDDLQEYDDGRRARIYYHVTYSYRAGDGHMYENVFDRSEPSETAEIEFLPSDPNVSRIKGVGQDTLLEWLLARGVQGALVMFACCNGIPTVVPAHQGDPRGMISEPQQSRNPG